jgi:hypothetical protein
MGKEERENKAARELAQVGAFNVKITVWYTDGEVKEYECKRWIETGGKLGLTLYDNTTRIIILHNVYTYLVEALSEKESDESKIIIN